ncbi:hypothetical protein LCGC14_1936930 [marine sediment metagenome]|uniref:Uncharacterized protein n=1 Tax=marine sediment metagenome TaxID=412755 RepID=A0A0F9HZZ8_9ZZZZ
MSIIKRKRIIRKPIPGEKLISRTTKRLLKRFDDGKITSRQLRLLDDAIRVETKGAGNLLERSFFADPRGRFRPSRLGISTQKDASLLDILKGDFTFKTPKPQILVFENVKVAKFPKALKDISKALKSGKALTKSQAKRLLNWQSKKTGRFKPIGALSREPEITLAAGEIIKKVKRVGTTIINGKRVPIVQVKVVKPSISIKNLLKKARSGKITVKELKQLRNKLKKETGFTSRLSRSRRLKPKRPPRRPPKRPPKRPPRRPPKRPPKAPPRPIPKRRKVKRKKRRGKPRPGYNVFARPLKKRGQKKIPKQIKVNRKPLSKNRARDVRNYITDTSLSRTGSIRPSRGKARKTKIRVPVGYAKRTSKKFRRHRRVRGKRRPLPRGKVIERRRHLLDTRQEKQKISLRRRIRQITPRRKPIKSRGTKRRQSTRRSIRKPVRRPSGRRRQRITGARRKQMLRNLSKARRVRAANLRRRPIKRKQIKRRTPKRRR